jgi:hypothetical protein
MKLFVRRDADRYIKLLESKLQEAGVDIEPLQSKADYKKVELKA